MTNTTETISAAAQKDYRSNSLWRLTLRRILRQQNAVIGLTILTVLVLVAIFASGYCTL